MRRFLMTGLRAHLWRSAVALGLALSLWFGGPVTQSYAQQQARKPVVQPPPRPQPPVHPQPPARAPVKRPDPPQVPATTPAKLPVLPADSFGGGVGPFRGVPGAVMQGVLVSPLPQSGPPSRPMSAGGSQSGIPGNFGGMGGAGGFLPDGGSRRDGGYGTPPVKSDPPPKPPQWLVGVWTAYVEGDLFDDTLRLVEFDKNREYTLIKIRLDSNNRPKRDSSGKIMKSETKGTYTYEDGVLTTKVDGQVVDKVEIHRNKDNSQFFTKRTDQAFLDKPLVWTRYTGK